MRSNHSPLPWDRISHREKFLASRIPLTLLPLKPSTQTDSFFLRDVLVLPEIAKVHLNLTLGPRRIAREYVNGDCETAFF